MIRPRRAQMIRTVLAGRLGRPWLRQLRQAQRCPVSVVLDVDREYRARASSGIEVPGARVQSPPPHEVGWTADSFLRPRANARSLRKPGIP